MSRVIATGETPAKKRHAHLRSCAEVVRLLAQRPRFETEEKDMAAFLVFNLRGVTQTIEDSADSWDDRDYWKKSEELRRRWRWARNTADELATLIREERWDSLPPVLIDLASRLSDVTVTAITRDADWWCGAHRALLRETA